MQMDSLFSINLADFLKLQPSSLFLAEILAYRDAVLTLTRSTKWPLLHLYIIILHILTMAYVCIYPISILTGGQI